MLKKDDAINAIGYTGMVALVDKNRRTKNKNKSVKDLLADGAYRSAAALALFNNSEEELQLVADTYNKLSGGDYNTKQIARLFGVAGVAVSKTLAL